MTAVYLAKFIFFDEDVRVSLHFLRTALFRFPFTRVPG